MITKWTHPVFEFSSSKTVVSVLWIVRIMEYSIYQFRQIGTALLLCLRGNLRKVEKTLSYLNNNDEKEYGTAPAVVVAKERVSRWAGTVPKV